MPDYKDIEARLREKYNFPDDDTTNNSPTETLLFGSLQYELEQREKQTALDICKDLISKNKRLKNLVALLWKACQSEIRDLGPSVAEAIKAISLGIYNGRSYYTIEEKANKLILEVSKILPPINDAELLAIRQTAIKRKREHRELQAKIIRQLARTGSVIANQTDPVRRDLVRDKLDNHTIRPAKRHRGPSPVT